VSLANFACSGWSGEEGFLAVEDRRIGAAAVVVAADLAGDEVDDDRLRKRGCGSFSKAG
jgi:hypothetical protein